MGSAITLFWGNFFGVDTFLDLLQNSAIQLVFECL